VGLLDRLRRRKAAPVVALDPADPSLVVLVEARDAAQADSAVLLGLDLERPVLVRHHLVGLPDAAAVAQAAELLGQDGYTVAPAPDGSPLAVHASRTQVLTALSASQERSRMAGLAQRLGGDVDGYDVLVHPS
jgi:hypothetical protein